MNNIDFDSGDEIQAKAVIACFGKSTVTSTDSAFLQSIELGEKLVHEGFAIIHGGQKGGLMQAVSFGAQTSMQALGITSPRDLAVDTGEEHLRENRTPHTRFITSSTKLSQRLDELTGIADAYVVMARGGLGTIAELAFIVHQNEIAREEEKKPIFILSDNWNALLASMTTERNINLATLHITCVQTVDELLPLLEAIESPKPLQESAQEICLTTSVISQKSPE